MFQYIKDHFGVFYIVAWVIWLVLAGLSALVEWAVGDIPMSVFGLILLPSNLISWPVALGYWETENWNQPKSFLGKRIELVLALLCATTLVPLALFFMNSL